MKNNIFILSMFCIFFASCNQSNMGDKPHELDNSKNMNTKEKAPFRPALNDGMIKNSIIGKWVLLGDDCQNKSGFNFKNNGKYNSDTEEGDWLIENQNLNIRAISNEGEAGIHSSNWKVKILDIDDNMAILQRDDGSNMQWSHCKK